MSLILKKLPIWICKLHVTMIRRSPTRIELKLDDMSDYNKVRREFELARERKSVLQQVGASEFLIPPSGRSKQDIFNERIGYVPTSKQN
ncbi:hypothetical protein M8J76_008454 [Diaphorina citri]|nr:hypothetical protein M8J75_005932 [Diaphorina citri]KAI5723592.1 hypothetical protein M8J76_008454 [Diaphorina citri]